MAQGGQPCPKGTDLSEPQTGTPPALDLILKQSHDGICLQDTYGRVEWMNPACEKLFGWSLDKLRGKQARDCLLPPGTPAGSKKTPPFRYDCDSPIFGDTVIRQSQRRDGTQFWTQQRFTMIDPGLGEAHKKVVITCRDVTPQIDTQTALEQVRVDLEHAAHRDDLTGLANRKKLTAFLRSDQVAQAIASGDIGVLQIDLDKFKDINDTHGHAAGDATLRHVADALCSQCDDCDLICRTGGDEFLMICLKPGNKDAVRHRANALLDAIAVPFSWQGQTISIGASVGACHASARDSTGEDLIRQADQALYRAKDGGRGQVVLYTEALGQQHQAHLRLVQELKNGLEQQQFEIHLQPQLCLTSNRIAGCEALIRWRHPQRGLLPPGAFLPMAERSGLLAEIDYVSMNLALDAFCALRKHGFSDLAMSINVSGSILSDVNYPGLLHWALQSRGINPESICVEILESTILDSNDLEFTTAVERLKRLGVKVALDDFGTGYAGLAHMSSFEIDALKLDRSMVDRLVDEPRNRVIVRAIIRLCDLLGIKVVAEGVETHGQLEILRRARCPVIQGFGLARPMPVETMITWLNDTLPLPSPFSLRPEGDAEKSAGVTRLRPYPRAAASSAPGHALE